MNGTTHIGLDYDVLPPSEFELTFFNSGGVEVGKYGDTSHTLEDCVLDSKLASGTVYGQTLVNIITNKTIEQGYIDGSIGTDIFSAARVRTKDYINVNGSVTIKCFDNQEIRQYLTYKDGVVTGGVSVNNNYKVIKSDDTFNQIRITFRNADNSDITPSNLKSVILEGDYANVDIPYFEGVDSTIVNGFTTVGKNLFSCSLTLGMWSTTEGKPISNDNYFRTTDFIKVHPNTMVKVSGTAFDPKATGNVMFYDKDKKYLGDNMQVWILNGAKIPSNAHYMTFHFGASNLYNINGTVQIEIVDDVSNPTTDYEPYKSIQYTLPTPITLNKVGDVVDTYDVVSGVETRNIDKSVLNASLNYTSFTVDDSTRMPNTPNHVFIELSSGQISHPNNKEFQALTSTSSDD